MNHEEERVPESTKESRRPAWVLPIVIPLLVVFALVLALPLAYDNLNGGLDLRLLAALECLVAGLTFFVPLLAVFGDTYHREEEASFYGRITWLGRLVIVATAVLIAAAAVHILLERMRDKLQADEIKDALEQSQVYLTETLGRMKEVSTQIDENADLLEESLRQTIFAVEQVRGEIESEILEVGDSLGRARERLIEVRKLIESKTQQLATSLSGTQEDLDKILSWQLTLTDSSDTLEDTTDRIERRLSDQVDSTKALRDEVLDRLRNYQEAAESRWTDLAEVQRDRHRVVLARHGSLAAHLAELRDEVGVRMSETIDGLDPLQDKVTQQHERIVGLRLRVERLEQEHAGK